MPGLGIPNPYGETNMFIFEILNHKDELDRLSRCLQCVISRKDFPTLRDDGQHLSPSHDAAKSWRARTDLLVML